MASQTQYGGLRTPKLTGLWGLSLVATGALVAAAVVLVGIIVVGLTLQLGLAAVVASGVWIVLSLGAILPEAIKGADGQGRWTARLAKRSFRRAEKTQKTVLSQGLTGVVPDATIGLPGVGAGLRLSEHRDIHGNVFGLLAWGADTNLYSVVINCHPTGTSGKDSDVFDAEVAQWAAWQGGLNKIGSVVAAQVCVETAPDSGQRLARAIDRGRADQTGVPEFTRQMVDQMKVAGQSGSPQVITRISITFSGEETIDDSRETHRRTHAEMAAQIGDLLPELVSTLTATGAGSNCRAARAQQIIDFTRVAFDPSVAALVEEAQLGEGTGLSWDEAGPLTAVNRFDHYQHESAFSRTLQVREMPKGAFFATVLKRLLEPHRDIVRKRVTICYRTESPLRSAEIAEHDVTAAQVAVSQSPRAKAAQEEGLEAARRTARQEALGAPLIRVGILVTVTAFDPRDLDRGTHMLMTRLAPQARLRLRTARGAQDSAFIAALPLGMVPAVHAGLRGLTDSI